MLALRDMYQLLRWRLIALRYLGKLRSYFTSRPRSDVRTAVDERLVTRGYDTGPTLPSEDVAQIRALYADRIAQVVPKPGGHPFVNLVGPEDLDPENPILRFAFSPAILDRAHDYFGGRFRFDSIQLLYSWPTEGKLLESQMWHRDYGDSKSLHCVAYVNEVLTPEHGPFGFVDRIDTRRIAASPFIRRISDEQFARELGDGVLRTFYGQAGESVFVDPANCYHYGSRCKVPRLAIFVTFNTDRPFVGPVPLIRDHAKDVLRVARELRPDLSDAYLSRILGA